MNVRHTLAASIVFCVSTAALGLASDQTPLVIKLEIPAREDTAGRIVVADVNDDGRLSFLVTKSGYLPVSDSSP